MYNLVILEYVNIVGIDASRNRSGGAKAYLMGILSEVNPLDYGIKEVHLWAPDSLLNKLENYKWLIKHSSRVAAVYN